MKFGSIFRKSAQKIQSDKNSGYITQIPIYINANISLNSFRMRNVSEKRL